MTNPDDVEVLASVPTEAEAAMLVAALKHDAIEAVAEGALTSALRAEVPGEVRILVHTGDLDRAQAVLTEFQQGHVDIDWSKVDLGEQEE